MNWPGLLLPSQFIDIVEEMESHERDEVERRKNRDGASFDRRLAESWLQRRQNDPGHSVSLGTEDLDTMCSHIGSSIDLVMQVLAHCETPEKATHLASALMHFGRLGRARFKVPSHLQAATKELVEAIDFQFNLSTPGVNNRKSARKKARQIIRKIEDMFSSTGVDWKPSNSK